MKYVWNTAHLTRGRKRCVCACLLSHLQRFATPWTAAHQAPLSVGFSRQEHLSGLLFPPQGNLPSPGIKPTSPALQVDSLSLSHQGSPKEKMRMEEMPKTLWRLYWLLNGRWRMGQSPENSPPLFWAAEGNSCFSSHNSTGHVTETVCRKTGVHSHNNPFLVWKPFRGITVAAYLSLGYFYWSKYLASGTWWSIKSCLCLYPHGTC